VTHAGDPIEHGDHTLARLVEGGAPLLGLQRVDHGSEHRLEASGALDAVGDDEAKRLGGEHDLGAQLDELTAAGRERFDERIGGRRAAVLQLARGLSELRPQVGEAPGEVGELASEGVEVDVHTQGARRF
jgi:hypothetical protein